MESSGFYMEKKCKIWENSSVKSPNRELPNESLSREFPNFLENIQLLLLHIYTFAIYV